MPALPAELRARRSDPLLRWVFLPYFRWLFRRRYAGLYLTGELPTQGPVLVLANHTSWWDGPLGLLMTGLFSPLAGYMAMEAENLARYPAFRRAGCFGLDRASPARALGALAYAGELLRQPDAAVWLFPQGRMRHLDQRPLEFEGGLGLLGRYIGDVSVVSVSFRFEAAGEERPEAHVWVDTPRRVPAAGRGRGWVAEEEARLAELMDRHRAARVAGERGRPLIEGVAGVDRAWDRARALEDRQVR